MNRLGALAWGSGMMVLAMGVACSDDGAEGEGAGGAAGSSAGTANAGASGKAGSSGTGGNPTSAEGGAGGDSQAGVGGTAAGTGGEVSPGGGAGEAGEAGAAGVGGQGGDSSVSCEAVRDGLLGPIDSVSTGLVTVTSEPNAAAITVVVDASAGGYMAAATNPYVYVSLANQARVDVTDRQADASVQWDLALKRDSIRSNGGDSGPGSAGVAELPGADFDTVTAAAATTVELEQDTFVEPDACEPITDETNKPITAFSGWYVYAPATMSLTPADKVYLVRGADGASLYKLRIDSYYADVDNGQGGTVKKSAVFTLTYRAL
jgi:HmuY protein